MPQPEQTQLLAFLDVVLVEDNVAIRGGTLITDMQTKPYEFRCTGPVRPTNLQRILYGATLDDYVYVDLIGIPLLKAAKEKPALVLIQNELLLRVRPTVAYPMVLLDAPSQTRTTGKQQISMRVHPDFKNELPAVQTLLGPLMDQRDLMEPFGRLRIALEEAHRQGIAEKKEK